MTGFAARTGEAAGQAWAWEARSVNGKGLDLRLRLPEGIEGLEAAVRAEAQARFARGNVTVALRLDRAAEVLAMRGVLDTSGASAEDDGAALKAALLADAAALLDALRHMRLAEGRALYEILAAQLARIESLAARAVPRRPRRCAPPWRGSPTAPRRPIPRASRRNWP